MDLKKEVRDLKRLEEILLVLVESGFGYLISKTKLNKLIPLGKRMKAKLKSKKKITDVSLQVLLRTGKVVKRILDNL